MDHDFWHQRWRENRIGFHNAAPNGLLTQYFDRLNLHSGQRVFLPLCGKTLDIDWLSQADFQVVGSELSEKAVSEVFDRLGLEPVITTQGALTSYSTKNLVLVAGDFFDISASQLGTVDAVYDRAALVALPKDMRARYSEHLSKITSAASQLLICFAYDQSRMHGPPFSVEEDEVAQLYGASFTINLPDRRRNTGNLADKAGGFEETWLLEPI